MSRRSFLGVGLMGTACAAAGAAAYARHVEPGWLRISRRDVPIPGLRGPIRIAHLSDLHASGVVPVDQIATAVDQTLAGRPDLVCMTGDYVTHRLPAGEAYLDVLTRLANAVPTYAVFGNHDGGSWVAPLGGYRTTDPIAEFLGAAGVVILHNAHTEFTVGDQRLYLAGVGDLWANACEPGHAMPATPDAPVVLMSHNPDSKGMLEPYAWDLMLCGHTHGGQLRLPLIGTPFAPVRDHRIVDGLHRWQQRWIHVTRGIGNLHGLRFNCRPEISLLDLQPLSPNGAPNL